MVGSRSVAFGINGRFVATKMGSVRTSSGKS
jgi:hypothetical protein